MLLENKEDTQEKGGLNKDVVTADDIDIIDVDEEDEVNEADDQEDEMSDRTFVNPSQSDKSEELFKCEICDFASARKEIIENHKELIHNWCPQCYSSFTTQNKLRIHIKKIHIKKIHSNK